MLLSLLKAKLPQGEEVLLSGIELAQHMEVLTAIFSKPPFIKLSTSSMCAKDETVTSFIPQFMLENLPDFIPL